MIQSDSCSLQQGRPNRKAYAQYDDTFSLKHAFEFCNPNLTFFFIPCNYGRLFFYRFLTVLTTHLVIESLSIFQHNKL